MSNEDQLTSNKSRLAVLENQRLVDIVSALGPEWKIIKADSRLFQFTKSDDWNILTTQECRAFDFCLSRELHEVYSYHTDKLPSANINASKSPEKVAAELLRRLVEPSESILAALKERLARKRVRDAKVQDNIKRLIDAHPEASQPREAESIYLNLYDSHYDRRVYLSGSVSEDSVHFERASL